MPGCSAIGCNNRSEKGFSMKCFPRDPTVRKIWKDRVCRADWEPSNNSFLCHVHFEPDQWTLNQNGIIKLKKNAIPSIFEVTSRRKSQRKRRLPINARAKEKDLYIIEYLEEPIYNNTYLQNSLCNWYTSHVDKLEDRFAFVRSNFVRAENIITENKKNYETCINESKIGLEVEEKMESTKDTYLDDLEEKLRSICDGETTVDVLQNSEKKESTIDPKITTEVSCTENGSVPVDNSVKNGKAPINNHEEEDNEEIIELKDEKRDEDKTALHRWLDRNNTNETTPKDETEKRSVFVIKLTGIDEDVMEIVKGLGTEPLLKYECSNEISNDSNKTLVTSIISMIETVSPSSAEQEDDVKPKIGNLSEDEQTPKFNTYNEKVDETESLAKLATESPDVDDYTMDYQQLRKQIKSQDEVIRKLKNHWKTTKESENFRNNLANTRSQAKRPKMDRACNGDCEKYESREKYVNDLSLRLRDSNETIKRLTGSLSEANIELKKCQSFLRQRDNHIKELNWKLNKASKYIERAEKNANNYRKKMMSLQNLLSKKKAESVNVEQPREERSTSISAHQTTLPTSQTPNFEPPIDKQCDIPNERIVCRTVQDIFEESNHCDDDDPIIDNPEDFMRQFAGSL